MTENKTVYKGFGLGTVVAIVLLVLKLTGAVNISWFWVIFPLWIAPAVLFSIGLLMILVAIILEKVWK